jgi:hypothetical protein
MKKNGPLYEPEINKNRIPRHMKPEGEKGKDIMEK